MIPPFIRRCPHCGHIGRTRRFTVVSDADVRRVECPSCHRTFEPIDNPLLN